MPLPIGAANRPPRPSLALGFVAWSGAALFVVSLAYFLYSYLVRYGRIVPGGDAAAPALFDVALFTIFAVHHSLLARTGIKQWLRRAVPVYLERSLYTWTASLLFLTVCWQWRLVPGVVYELRGPAAFAGYAVQLLAVALTAGGAAAVDVLDLAGVRPFLDASRGTAPRHVPLETRGAYAIVRHPVYLAWALLVFGAPSMTATRAVFAIVSTLYLAVAIPLEERSLLDVFGAEYEAYRRTVRWRMIPGIY